METTSIGVVAVLLGLLIPLMIFSPIILAIVVRWLADRELFFARANESEYRAVMRNGAFKKGVVVYKGFEEGPDGSIVSATEKKVFNPLQSWFQEKCGGIFPLWIPKVDEVYRYMFRWNKVYNVPPTEKEDGYVGKLELPNKQFAVSYQKEISYILLKDTSYFLLLKAAETIDESNSVGITVNIYAYVTLRVMNPYKALFRVDNWLDVTLIATESALRSWAARTTYRNILKKKEILEHQADDEFLNTLTEKGEQLTKYVLERYGSQIKRIQFLAVELPDAVNNEINAAEAARKEAEKTLTLAAANRKRIEEVYDPVIKRGEAGLAIRALESLDKAGESKGNWVITAGPGLVGALAGLASGINTKKSPDPTPTKSEKEGGK